MYWKVGKLVLSGFLLVLALRIPAEASSCTTTCASYRRACGNDCLNNAACIAQCNADLRACNCECGSCT